MFSEGGAQRSLCARGLTLPSALSPPDFRRLALLAAAERLGCQSAEEWVVSSDLLSRLWALVCEAGCFQGHQDLAQVRSRCPSRLVQPGVHVRLLPSHTGSLCGDGTGTCYPPAPTPCLSGEAHRRRGLALAMLQDFCQTFREDEALVSVGPSRPGPCTKVTAASGGASGEWDARTPVYSR